MKDLKIAIFLDSILERNGVGSYYKDLIENIENQIGSIDLINPDNKEYTHWFKPGFPGDNSQKLHFPKLFTIINHIKENKPDVIILPMVAPFSLLGFYIAKRHKIPYYFVLHNNSEKLLSKNLKGWIGNILKNIYVAIDNFMTKESPNILALNNTQIDGINIKNKKIKIIGTTLSNKFVEKPIKTLNKKTKNILFIGRLSPEKNIDEVVKAAKEIDHLNFFIAGDGPLREYILKEEKKYKNMIYLGWVQRENIIETIDKADIIILPSSFETFGTAALEGMSRGKLVIVSEETGIIEWPNLKNNLFILKKNENISEIIKNIDNLPENIQQEKSINAAISAKSHNNTAINTWLELLTEKKLTV